jgi:hypothetical protein
MSEMVERVARAICSATNIAMDGETDVAMDNPDFVIPAHRRLDRKSIARWELYVRQARVAIEAMREPTDEMCEAADWQQQSEVNQYQAAIDAALCDVDANK